MVVDCGGGTVDITVYEMTSDTGKLKELYMATGGPHGSTGMYGRLSNTAYVQTSDSSDCVLCLTARRDLRVPRPPPHVNPPPFI